MKNSKVALKKQPKTSIFYLQALNDTIPFSRSLIKRLNCLIRNKKTSFCDPCNMFLTHATKDLHKFENNDNEPSSFEEDPKDTLSPKLFFSWLQDFEN